MTRDEPASGVVVYQPKSGFRYGAEAFWLAGFALEGGSAERALDLGTGSGIIAMLLGSRGTRVTGYDSRSEWCGLWTRSLDESSLRSEVRLVVRDVAVGVPDAGVDLVVCNPPFFPAASGPASGNPWKAAARTECTATLTDFVSVAVGALRRGGRACFVVPREREQVVSHAAAGRSRCVQVGRSRSLVELVVGGVETDDIVRCAETSSRARHWYMLANARIRE